MYKQDLLSFCQVGVGGELVVVNVHTEAELASTTVSDMASRLEEEMTELKTVVVAGHLNLIHGTGRDLIYHQ